MKPVLLFLIILSTTFQLKAQNRLKDGLYVNTNGDTVICKIITTQTISDDIDFPALSKRLKVIENNEKKKFNPSEVKSFILKDNLGVEHKFVSIPGYNKRFLNEVIKGRLSFYTLYSNHLYDGAVTKVPIMVKDDKIVFLNIFNPKKIIGDLISDCPQLFKEWIETKKYSIKDKESIVRAYNDCM